MNTIKSEDIAGTLLGEVFQMTKEDLERAKESLAEEAVTATEKPIGALNGFEEKIYALLFKKAKHAETMEAADEEGSHEYKGAREDISLLKDLVFNQIKKRFKLDGENTGIRADFQIVIREEDGEDCSQCPVRELCPSAH